MADIFFNNNRIVERKSSGFEDNSNYWKQKNNELNQRQEDYKKDLEAYSVYLPQEEYDLINNAIANAEIPEDEAYRWASALELNRQYEIPVEEGYKNLEQITASLWGDNFKINTKIASMEDSNGNILNVYFIKKANYYYAHLKVKSNNVTYLIYSEPITLADETVPIQIWFRRIDNLFDVDIVELE